MKQCFDYAGPQRHGKLLASLSLDELSKLGELSARKRDHAADLVAADHAQVFAQIAQDEVVVSGDPETRVEPAEPLLDGAPKIKGRVRWHPGALERAF